MVYNIEPHIGKTMVLCQKRLLTARNMSIFRHDHDQGTKLYFILVMGQLGVLFECMNLFYKNIIF